MGKWELIEIGLKGKPKVPASVGIAPYGHLSFNKTAWEMLGKPEWIFVYVDRKGRRMGFVKAPQGDGLKVRQRSKSVWYASLGKLLLPHYDIHYEKLVRCWLLEADGREPVPHYIELPENHVKKDEPTNEAIDRQN